MVNLQPELTRKQGSAVILVVLILLVGVPLVFRTPTGMEGVRVAVYFDSSVHSHSAKALENMFQWMNAYVTYVNSTEIRDGALEGYDIVVFPGGPASLTAAGAASRYSFNLKSEGCAIICDFIARGGSYFGVGGGSVFGTSDHLCLFDGQASLPVAGSTSVIMEMSINRNSTGPDLSNEPETCKLLYLASGYFYSDNMSGVIPIASFLQNDEPGMIVCTYGEGRVFLSFPHPEYEENDSRDGTDYFDDYDDPDSEWNLLLKIAVWLVQDYNS
ncbi:MAG: hypothetical protein JSW05_09380 [Candidatus Thorarchaeota archaeon]|nr:MAG: hypothetical protein JSW05_09380 [Candidatus Thorarchaeota archaeon]